MRFIKSDGGRKAAGYKGVTGDCVVRCLSILSRSGGRRYKEIYRAMAAGMKAYTGGPATVRKGVHRSVYEPVLEDLGFAKLAEDADEYSAGKLLDSIRFRRDHEYAVRTKYAPPSRKKATHLIAVVNATIYDHGDPRIRGCDFVVDLWKRPLTKGGPLTEKNLKVPAKKIAKKTIQKTAPKPNKKIVQKREICDLGCGRKPAPHGTDARYNHESRYHGKIAICEPCKAAHKRDATARKERRIARLKAENNSA